MAIAISSIVTPARAISVFQVGNSFTLDSKPDGTAAMLAYALGEPVDLGYHVRGNQTLNSLWSNPYADDTFTTSFGAHPEALPNHHWDYLTLQTFPAIQDPVPTLGQELARIQDFVQAADAGSGGATEIIVYGPWVGWNESDWNRWYDPVENTDEQLTIGRADYHDLLYDRVEDLYPGRVRLASAGKVIRACLDRILQGDWFLDNSRDLYRDSIHLNEVGRFVASTTVFTTITKINPIGMPPPRDVWSEQTLPDALALDLQQIVWETLVDDRRSGVSPVGDYNVDTQLDQQDYEAWVDSYAARTDFTVDPNGDGVVDGADGQLWLDGLDPGAADINLDGVADTDDLAIWVEEYGFVGESPADINADGFVDAADYVAWRNEVKQAQLADFNGDGIVDAADGQLWLDQFGWASRLSADGNGDGAVNAADYTIWRNAVEATVATTTAVPEPATLLPLLSALLLVRRRVAHRV